MRPLVVTSAVMAVLALGSSALAQGFGFYVGPSAGAYVYGDDYYDAPAVRQIVRDTAAHDDRWSALILEIVKSGPFRMRRSES